MTSNCHASRRRQSAIALALVLSFLFPAGAAADPYRESALDLTRQLVALFPPGEGYVVSLPAGEVYVDLAEANLMRPGMELFVYREGADIHLNGTVINPAPRIEDSRIREYILTGQICIVTIEIVGIIEIAVEVPVDGHISSTGIIRI